MIRLYGGAVVQWLDVPRVVGDVPVLIFFHRVSHQSSPVDRYDLPMRFPSFHEDQQPENLIG